MSFVDNCLFVLPDFRTRILTKVYKFCSSRSNLILLVLLNKVWGLDGCPLKEQTVNTNRYVRFGFSVATVLVAGTGFEVSFYTTVGGVGFA